MLNSRPGIRGPVRVGRMVIGAMLAVPMVAGGIVFATLQPMGPAWAQATAQKPQVRLPPRILIEVDVETPLMINVGPAEAMPPNSYLQLRGLPESATLNEGHSISPGTWAVPLRSLSNLSIVAPQAATGTSEFTVRVVSLDGAVLAETKSSIIVAAGYVIGQRSASAEPPRIVQPPMPASPPTPPPAAAVPQRSQVLTTPVNPAPAAPSAAPKQQLAADEKAKLERFVGLGNRHLASGNIAAAREFYRRAADGGLAEGALLLATTYDPAELDAIRVQGLSADPAEARRWYERARALGASGIDARLARLGSR